MPPKEDGTRARAKIIKMMDEHKKAAEKHPDLVCFKCLIGGDYEDIVAYNDVVDHIEADHSWDGVWKFREILAHHGPLRPTHENYKGSKYNVLVEWETGERTWEPLTTHNKQGVADTDPVTAAAYARVNNLLDTPGWRMPRLRKYAKTQQRMIRSMNQAKLHSFRHKPIYMHGYQVPRNHQQAMDLDRANGNTKWRDSELLELKQIDDYNTFLDKGKDWKAPSDYQKISVHIVYAVKHCG